MIQLLTKKWYKADVWCVGLFVCLMVFNATFNNISVISWRAVLLVEEYPENTTDLSQVTDKLSHIMLYISVWSRDSTCCWYQPINTHTHTHTHIPRWTLALWREFPYNNIISILSNIFTIPLFMSHVYITTRHCHNMSEVLNSCSIQQMIRSVTMTVPEHRVFIDED